MAHIRTWKELQKLGTTPAEEQLIEACQKGEFCVLVDGKLPPKGTPDPSRYIRADVLRYLILGGCDDCIVDDIGVALKGAHVTGRLNLNFTTTCRAIQMHCSRFEDRIDCEQTHCRQLAFNSCDLQGIRGPMIKVSGSFFLRNSITHAAVNLPAATIGGELSCRGTKFNIAKGNRVKCSRCGNLCGPHLQWH